MPFSLPSGAVLQAAASLSLHTKVEVRFDWAMTRALLLNSSTGIQALLSIFPHYHAKDHLIKLVRKACSTTFLLHFVLAKPEVEAPGRLSHDHEMMRLQINNVLRGDSLVTQ